SLRIHRHIGDKPAAFRIADAEDNAFTLPQAIRLVSQHPAQALGLDDRGVIAEGKRADLGEMRLVSRVFEM
ncbi:amidohydrolase family protein, partial [Klebsiella pneumoniae]|nr:amidohydrolase family protein [Klebsiella pneumoniae]